MNLNDPTVLIVVALLAFVALATAMFIYAAIASRPDQRTRLSNTSDAGPTNDSHVLEFEGISVSVAPLQSTEVLDSYTQIPLSKDLENSLSPIVEQIPLSVISVSMMAGRAVSMTFPPAAELGLLTGELTQIPGRALAQNASGQIAAHGSIIPLHPVGAPIFVWQVLAMITFKKHLSIITRQLANIQSQIHDIKEWLHEERLGRLIGNLQHLSKLVDKVQSDERFGENPSPIMTEVRNIQRECLQIMAAEDLRLSHLSHVIKESKFGGENAKEAERKVLGIIDEYSRSSKSWSLAALVNATTILPCLNQRLSRNLAGDFDDLIHRIENHESRQTDFFADFNECFQEFTATGWFYRQVDHPEKAKKLRRQGREEHHKLKRMVSLLEESVRQGRDSVVRYQDEQSERQELVVLLNDRRGIKGVGVKKELLSGKSE